MTSDINNIPLTSFDPISSDFTFPRSNINIGNKQDTSNADDVIKNQVLRRGTMAPQYSNSYDPLNNKIIHGNNTLDHTGAKGLDGTSLRGTPLGRYGYGSVVFMIVFTFVISLIFGSFSLGFAYFLLFWGAWIFAYALLVNFQFPFYRLFYSFAIFMVGVLGFIIGRLIVGDNNPFKGYYD